jgi:hypothetical protein
MIKNTNKDTKITNNTNDNNTYNQASINTIQKNRLNKHRSIDVTKITRSLNEIEDYLIEKKNKL